MMHNVYLQGELGEKFGHKFVVDATSYQDVIRCINANRPEFKQYLVDCHHNDIGFIFDTAGKEVEEETELFDKLKEGDITIAIAPMGSKSGFAKILAAIAILVVIFYPPAAAALAKMGAVTVSGGVGSQSLFTAMMAGNLSGLASFGVLAATNVGMGLLSMGMQQLMAPDPSIDRQDASSNYLFDGAAGASREGDPSPILYGELRIPGRPIVINVIPGRFRMASTNITYNGDLDAIDLNTEEDNSSNTTTSSPTRGQASGGGGNRGR